MPNYIIKKPSRCQIISLKCLCNTKLYHEKTSVEPDRIRRCGDRTGDGLRWSGPSSPGRGRVRPPFPGRTPRTSAALGLVARWKNCMLITFLKMEFNNIRFCKKNKLINSYVDHLQASPEPSSRTMYTRIYIVEPGLLHTCLVWSAIVNCLKCSPNITYFIAMVNCLKYSFHIWDS